jgi:hypothetical protein
MAETIKNSQLDDMPVDAEPTLEELEEEMQNAMAAYKKIVEQLKACTDKESDEYFDLSMAEFNMFNYIDMLDYDIEQKRKIIMPGKS